MAADSNRNLAAYPGMRGDFVSIPTDAQLTNIALPNNLDLPNPVADNLLYPVPKNRQYNIGGNYGHSLLTWSVDDGNGASLGDRQLIATAYTRVTGHALLDDPTASFDIGQNPTGEPRDEFKHFTYASIHNNLIVWRSAGLIEGAGLYHIARRLVTYATEKNPNLGLGPLSGGTWWLAPDPYHIVTVIGYDPTKSGGDHGRGFALEFGNDRLDPGAVPGYGLDRAEDEQRFDDALFTVHWISILKITGYKQDPQKKKKYTPQWEENGAHWAVVIRHKETNEGFFFDSLMEGFSPADRSQRLQRVRNDMNDWLQRCGKPQLERLRPVLTPQQSTTNSCGIHTIASVVAFICYGRIGWDQVPDWKPRTAAATNKTVAENKMAKDISDSVHKLMGLQFLNGNDIRKKEAKARMFTGATGAAVLNTLGAKPPNPPKPPITKPPTKPKPNEDMEKAQADLDQRRAELEAMEQALAVRRANIEARETAVATRESAVAQREVKVNAKMEKYQKKKEKLKSESLKGMDEKIKEAKARSKELKKKEKMLAEWEARLQALEDQNANPKPGDDQDNDTTLVNQDDDDDDDEEMSKYEDIWYTMHPLPNYGDPEPVPPPPDEDWMDSPTKETITKQTKYSYKCPGVTKPILVDADEPQDAGDTSMDKPKTKVKGLAAKVDDMNKEAGLTTRSKSFTMAALKRKLDDLAEKTDKDTKKRKKDLADREADLNAAIAHRVAQEQRLKELQKQQKFLERQQHQQSEEMQNLIEL